MKKRVFCLLAVLSLMLSLLPLCVLAYVPSEGYCGYSDDPSEVKNNISFTLVNDVLTFSGKGKMKNWSSGRPQSAAGNLRPWVEGSYGIKKVIVNEGITTVGSYACQHSISMTEVTLPDSVVSIEKGAFHNCSALPEIDLPDRLTSIGDSAFAGCASLSVLDIPDTVTSIGTYAFEGCTSLVSVSLPKNLTVLSGAMFGGCSALTGIEIPAGVTAIDYSVFRGCTSLAEITIPEGVVSIGVSAFDKCVTLKDIQLPHSLQTIDRSAFSECQRLEQIIFPSGIKTLGNDLFAGAMSLVKIVFQGDVPEIGHNAFAGVIADVYYPRNVGNWSDEDLLDYGGTLNWIPYEADHVHAHKQTHIDATCTEQGATAYICDCGNRYDTEVFPAIGHDFQKNTPAYWLKNNHHESICARKGCGRTEYRPCSFAVQTVVTEASYSTHGIMKHSCEVCGGWTQENYLLRISGSTRYDTAFRVADELKSVLGVDKFDTVIVASGTNFADALSGSYLANVKNAPILLVRDRAQEINAVRDYIRNNLTEGGTVYLLGGTAAVPASMESGLSGFSVKRLWGKDRYGTNLEILKEAGVGNEEVLVATGRNYADSLSASAAGKPILLIKDSLTDKQLEFLKDNGGGFTVIGGTNAVSTAVEAKLSGFGPVLRVGGADRYETSILVALEFLDRPEGAMLAYAGNFPDGLCGGPLAAKLNMPLILTANGKTENARAFTQLSGIQGGTVLGGATVLSEQTARNVFGIS